MKLDKIVKVILLKTMKAGDVYRVPRSNLIWHFSHIVDNDRFYFNPPGNPTKVGFSFSTCRAFIKQ